MILTQWSRPRLEQNRSDWYDNRVGAKLEKDVEWECLTYLVSNGWWPWKNPTIGVYDAKAGAYRRSSNVFCINGAADIIAIRDGVVVFIEVKSARGKQSKAQQIFENNIKRRGGHYYLVHSVQELREKLDEL